MWKLSPDVAYLCSRVLQKNALDKLDARSQLNSSGKMSLKIKLSKSLIKGAEAIKQSVSVDSNSTGQQLAEEIASLVRPFNILTSIMCNAFTYNILMYISQISNGPKQFGWWIFWVRNQNVIAGILNIQKQDVLVWLFNGQGSSYNYGPNHLKTEPFEIRL